MNPGLQMFGQSISGSVDMDGNGYAGKERLNHIRKTKTSNGEGGHYEILGFFALFFCLPLASLRGALLIVQSTAQTRDRGILFTAFHG